MATVTLSAKSAATVAADALVVAVGSSPDGPRVLGTSLLPPGLVRRVRSLLEPLGITGAADEVHRLPSDGAVAAALVVLTGVGPLAGGRALPSSEAVRRAAGAATRSLAGRRTVAFAMPVDGERLGAVCEGALLGAYAFTRYRSTKPDTRPGTTPGAGAKAPVRSVVVLTDQARSRAARDIAQRAQTVADAVRATRDLINTPPSDLYPQTFAEAATAAAAELPVKVTVLDERRLARGGYGGLMGVGQGSSRPPRLVRLDYSPAGASAHVALVGKGITFDTGGISLKPPAGMELMKSDMSGAAAVLGTVVAVARLGLPVRVTGWLALAENMPSGTATRPSDVITIRGGTTVEVLNTDAEGRLVLADALVDAVAAEPDLIVDVATLTGAQMVALGKRVSAIMANDDGLRDRLHRVAEAAGEQFWPMPLPADLRAAMDSPVADIANMGEQFGGMLTAGVFLAEFVGGLNGPIPWAHLDIAGPAFNSPKPYGYTPVGGTGVAVRTMLALVEDVAAQGARTPSGRIRG
ncbi:MAG: leucyl aminopeptidase [Kineosporiaceae bacterium]|nr:leucyl aminopeptidase [Kineosporiaceae bacterium]MBK7624496.1 leucyl aminopeptidase [Kineosporiaceae bacterium]MBK8077134.1 leucyl aminopeptidase [Kineosporiaceae bacterium]